MIRFNINENLFRNKFADPGLLLVLNGEYWSHIDNDESSSLSIQYDKGMQEYIKKIILERYQPKTSILCKGASVRSIVLPHATNKYILHFDIEGYYASICFEHVEPLLRSLGKVDDFDLKVFSGFYFYAGGLRKGLYASPIISEILGVKIDNIIRRIIHEEGFSNISYSRYYDDLLLSGNSIQTLRLIEERITEHLCKIGLKPNSGKTKLLLVNNAKILGLRIHDGVVTVPKDFKKRLRPRIKVANTLWENEEKAGWRSYDNALTVQKKVYSVLGTLQYIIDNTGGNVEKYQRKLIEFRKKQGDIEKVINSLSDNSKVLLDSSD